MARSVTYGSGIPDRLQPEDVTTVPKFTEFARQELGLSYPLGKGRREGWMKYCKEEMSTQSWTFKQLITAVTYIKDGHRSCRTLYGILHYIDEAGDVKARVNKEFKDHNLHVNVAAALETEQDEEWRRRLSLAQGPALELAYAQWRAEQ